MHRLRARLPDLLSVRGVVLLLIVATALVAALATARPALLAPGEPPSGGWQSARPTEGTPSYGRDIDPIFARACVRCHGPQRADKGLRLDSFQRTMAGDSYGTVVIPGDSSLSALISILRYGTMPHGAARLTAAEIEMISRWIDAGALEN